MGEHNGSGDGITRRDFLDGVAISAAGLAAAAAAPHLTGAEAALAAAGEHAPGALPPGYDPTVATGLRGQSDALVERIMRIDGPPNPDDVHSTRGGPGIHVKPVQSGERYDCVIVGAGASGLAAAKFYLDRFPGSSILILEAAGDYGGHSARNQATVAGTTFIRNGGTVNLDSIGTWNQPAGPLLDIPAEYGQPSVDLLDWVGVDHTGDSFPSLTSTNLASRGLRQMLLFPKEDWGADDLVQNRRTGESWPEFLTRTPYSGQAAAAIAAIQTDEDTDWLTLRHGPMSVDAKIQLLTRITYKQYLREYVGAPEEAILEYQRRSHSLLGAGVQAVSAADSWLLELPGFGGLGLPDPTDITFPGIGRTPQMGWRSVIDPTLFWPDGNASLLRLVLSKLIPAAVPDVGGKRPDQETIVVAQTDYSALDRPGQAVRIRLNSLVTRVKPSNGDHATVDYLHTGGSRATAYRIQAGHVIMACWNRVTAHVVEGLPRDQVQGLCYARKVPLIYGRAVLRDWKAWDDAKISSVSPRGNSLFWDTTSLTVGQRWGSVYGPTPTDASGPAVLNFTVVPSDPNRTPQLAAYEAGRRRLLEMSFAELEGALYDVIDRSVNAATTSGAGFDPQRDVSAIFVNRWNYGYAHELTSVWDPSTYGPDSGHPHVRGRRPYRNVAIANSDSASFAYTHSAINEGHRAVQDLPEPRGRGRGRGKG